MIALDPTKRRRLVGALRLTASDNEGESQAALAAAVRIAKSENIDLAHALECGLGGAPTRSEFRHASAFDHCLYPWRQKARKLLLRPLYFNDREQDFLRDMTRRADEPTRKQADWLEALYLRVPAGGDA